MDQKQQFVSLPGSGHFTVTELCGQFGISRKTGHKWLARHAEGGMMALADRSRAPKSVTCRTTDEVDLLIDTEKRLHSSWGTEEYPSGAFDQTRPRIASRRQHGG